MTATFVDTLLHVLRYGIRQSVEGDEAANGEADAERGEDRSHWSPREVSECKIDMIHVATSGSECRRLEHFAVSNFDLASTARRVLRVMRHDDERRALHNVQFEQ